MEITIFGFKLRVEILILIAIVYFIMATHTICGCCNYGLIETFSKMVDSSYNDMSGNMPGGGILANKLKTQKEGFAGANANFSQYGSESVDTSSWFAQNMVVKPGQSNSAGVNSILNRAPQPVPLPEGEMLLFATTPFKPECCPNTYTSSQGCACMTGQQYNYLTQRGMNNVPYSEY